MEVLGAASIGTERASGPSPSPPLKSASWALRGSMDAGFGNEQPRGEMSSAGPVLSRPAVPRLPGGGSVPPRKPPASSHPAPLRCQAGEGASFISLSLVFRSFTGNGFIARDLIRNSPTGGFFSRGRESCEVPQHSRNARITGGGRDHGTRIYTRVYACMSIHIYKCISIDTYRSRLEAQDVQTRLQRSA